MKPPIADKILLKWLLALSIPTLIAVSGSGISVFARQSANSRTLEAHEEVLGDHETRIRGVELQTERVLRRLESKLDRLLEDSGAPDRKTSRRD